MTFLRAIILVLFCSLTAQVAAQDLMIRDFTQDTIQLRSDFLDSVQNLQVYLPPGYEESSKIYPVVYTLNELQEKELFQLKELPEAVIIALENDEFSSAEGEKNRVYLDFLEKELQYFIQTHFKTGRENFLIGKSSDAPVILDVLQKRPNLFSNYVLIDPEVMRQQNLSFPAAAGSNEKPSIFLAVKEGRKAEFQQLHSKLQEAFGNASLYLKEFPEFDLTTAAMEDAFVSFEE